jgi:hypothetical protein
VKRDPAAQVGVSEGQTQPWPTDPQRVVCGVGEHRDVGGARLSHGSDHLHVMAARLAGEALRLALRPQEVPQRGAASGPANTLPRGANRASNATSMRVWGRQAPGRSRLGLVTWWCEPPLLNPACCRADQSGCGRGCRRPKMKYAIGTAPAELTTVTTVAHIHFGPRIWLAGRRLMSISAASLRMPSATAVMVSSLRVRWLRSLHCLLAAMPSSACTQGISDGLHLTSVWHPHCVAILLKLPHGALRGAPPARETDMPEGCWGRRLIIEASLALLH